VANQLDVRLELRVRFPVATLERLDHLGGRSAAAHVLSDLWPVVDGERRRDQDQARNRLGVAQRIVERDEAAVRVPQQDDLPQPELLTKRLGVGRELPECECLGLGPLGAAVSAVVIEDEPQPVAERIEPGMQVRVVEPEPAVHRQAGIAAPDGRMKQPCSVDLGRCYCVDRNPLARHDTDRVGAERLNIRR
jgi:hypothetical protein